MGEEIRSSEFSPQDFAIYKRKLDAETGKLAEIFAQQRFARSHPVAGFELEAWLIDERLRPVPRNEEFLTRFHNPLASPELASFNIEVNTEPRSLQGHVFSAMHQSLDATWTACRDTAQAMGIDVIMCGILPSLLDADLTVANMSSMQRYRALNREVLSRRKGKPLVLDINGVEHLRVTHQDVMLESAATSFQLHTQINQDQAARLYNASQILSAPMAIFAGIMTTQGPTEAALRPARVTGSEKMVPGLSTISTMATTGRLKYTAAKPQTMILPRLLEMKAIKRPRHGEKGPAEALAITPG